ncbi:MAG: tetratricopeptide repeat protein [Sedimentisphaerales bacterium]|nr:tetratricopeptide repeat protein [Sedimentisphaerales bacterium]
MKPKKHNEKDFFAGEKEFYKALKSSMKNGKNQDDFFSSYTHTKSRKLTGIQVVLLILIVVIIVPMIYITISKNLQKNRLKPQQLNAEETSAQITNIINPDISGQNKQTKEISQIDSQIEDVPEPESVSLQLANQSFAQENYTAAFNDYEKLHRLLPESGENLLVRDFVRLRMALCLEKLGQSDQAERLLRIVSASDSCALAAIAYYHRALIESDRKLFLQARTCAYQAMALCQAVAADTDWALKLQRNCHLLIALCLSQKVMALTDTDHDTPEKIWKTDSMLDPCGEMNEQQLQAFLKSGTDKLNKAIIGPRINRLEIKDEIERFQIISKLAPIEELLARFAANAKIKLVWDLPKNSIELRKKPVTLYLDNALTEEFAVIAAGCAGLKASIYNENNTSVLIIENPAQYTELSSHINSINESALNCWNSFIIKYHGDQRLDTAHYSMGMLYKINLKTNEAITQFKLLSSRYGYSPLAKYALLQSSKIKSDLHDYAGAREDLQQLIEQHHQSQVAQKACMYLADSSYKAGLYQEAATNYQKVYNFDYSVESKSTAALGAAKSFYMSENYVLSEDWLQRYIGIAKAESSPQLQCAYMLLGKIALKANKPEQAFNAFKKAVSQDINRSDRNEIISALLQSDLDILDPAQALDVLNKLQDKALSSSESIQILLIRSQILRKIHLPEKALVALTERIEYIADAPLKVQAYIEMAKVLTDLQQQNIAQSYLTKALALAQPPLNYQITLQLAKIALQLGDNNQAIELCTKLIKQNISEQQHAEAVEIITQGYLNRQEYGKALTSLLEQEQKKNKEQNALFEQNEQTKTLMAKKMRQDS